MYMNTNLAVPREAESALADENEALARLYAGQSLTQEEAETLFASLVEGRMAEPAIAAMLIALKLKGESADELIGAARALRAACLPFDRPAYPFADSCGTGGDGAGTINLSTAVAFVAAAAGLPVAKHGNRSFSSSCGSADVLEALGVRIDMPPALARRALDETGICFLFAPAYHPGLRHAGPVRKALKVRTVMNVLGPCLNPAAPPVQLLGVAERRLIAPVAQVLAALGVERALVVHGAGLDEIALHDETQAVPPVTSRSMLARSYSWSTWPSRSRRTSVGPDGSTTASVGPFWRATRTWPSRSNVAVCRARGLCRLPVWVTSLSSGRIARRTPARRRPERPRPRCRDRRPRGRARLRAWSP